MSLEIVILAAGFGTRMKSKKAKVLHKICGKEMIYHIIKESKKLTENITVILGHQNQEVKAVIDGYFDRVKTVIQDIENYPGTGGALLGVSFSSDRVLVLNGDMPLVSSSDLEPFLSHSSEVVASVIELENPSGYGRAIIEQGKLKKIVEQKDADADELAVKTVNAGVYLFSKSFLEEFLPKLDNNNKQKEYYITDLVEFANQKSIGVDAIVVSERSFKGVNSKLDLGEAEEILNAKIVASWAKEGVRFTLPKTTFVEEGVEFEGECVVESNCTLKAPLLIKNSIIKSGSVVEESVIEDSTIGPLAHIRPNSVIKASHIGNFTEVKKSTLKGVKANHLSYIGDAEVDEGTNIGAGTITCNYDGKSKYKTKIGKNVFIGSDTQLVAPVELEDDVIVGAGSTITKNVKKGELALSRSPQKNISDFFYRFFGK
jgi:bifunctional UDP-N-acetylglucosamine pyrophosphorylase/glucosamine-1-phosphate N-acetyltransferase